jgi:D-alanyl-lipoteichoic acid acyltransferase DltB (MBOAT superfamily)
MDVYRNEIQATKNVSDYAFYMTFFPHLVAGPIVRAKDFLPQIFTPQIINAALYKESLFRILIGLLKKLFIADYIGKFVDIVHQSPANFSGAENLLAMYGYSFQIYFDFSGYSDIAIGIALMLGYRLKENFDNPYSSSNITVFWRKWHISLSSWLRDYIYIPLGGNRKGVFNTYLFLMITMLVGGFWHGADWRFIFWGFAHGLALAFHKAYSYYFPNNKNSVFSRFWGTILTFHFVAFCWIFFRASSFQSAFTSITQICSNFNLKDFGGFWISRSETGFMLIFAALVAFFYPKWKDTFYQKIQTLPSFTWIIWVLVTLQIIVQFKDDLVQPFIYFQF